MLVETKKQVRNNRFKKGFKQALDPSVKTDKKTQVRSRVEKEVFDLEDSVADNAKMTSLLISVVSRLYNVMDDTMKDKLPLEERAMIEGVFNKFKTINTRADVQFAKEGMNLVDKLLERQDAIGKIVSE